MLLKKQMKITLITSDSESERLVLENQLSGLLQDNAEIQSFGSNYELADTIKSDLIVFSSKYVHAHFSHKINEDQPIVIARRALNMLNINKIFSLPKDAVVLIVNDLMETAIDVIELINTLGINHFKMIPFYPGCRVSEKPTIAITPGEGHLAPDFIKEIIDIGARVIDLTTIVEILGKLNMLDEKAHYFSAKYLEATVHFGKQLYSSIEESNKTNDYLIRVLNQIDDGIIAFDHSGKIFVFNEKSEGLFKLRQSYVIGKNIQYIIKDQGIINFLLAEEDNSNQLFKINNSEILIRKFIVGKLDSIVCTLKESRQIVEIESKLRHNLVKRGHIGKYYFEDIIGSSVAITTAIDTAKKISHIDLSVLIQGASGTGKELFASAIHNESKRETETFLAVNFSALSEDLAESELFGYEEGAFTGAKKSGKIGLFEQANNGTIFLDEIGDTSPKIQTRLLRVLQEKEIMRVGGTEIVPINVRVIAATNKDLFVMCREGRFREDLFYRLKKLFLKTPALKERKEDIEPLVRYFIAKNGRGDLTVSDEVLSFLMTYDWPGNVRELENIIEYMIAVSNKSVITIDQLPWDFFDENLSHPDSYESKEMSISNVQREEYAFILEKIRDHNEFGRAISRKLLSQLSKEFKYILSENQIRTRTDALMDSGLLFKSKGRAGMQLSVKGVEFLQTRKS